MGGVTSGLTVLELGEGFASSYGAKLLADHGSEVIKVEPPEGDRLRRAGPFRDDEPSIDGGGLWNFLNTSKRSVTIDRATREGQRLVGRLIEQADVVVHTLVGAARADLGLGTPERDEAGLVEVAVTPYGLDGPYRDFAREPITLAALSGWMFCMGDQDRAPLFPGGPYIEYLAGISAAAGALIGVAAKAKTGLGQVVDVSEFEVGVEALVFDPSRYSYAGTNRTRTGDLYGGDPMAALYPCADGYFQFHAGRAAPALLRVVGGDQLATDDRFRTPKSRFENRDALRQALIDGLADKRRWELFEQCGQDHIVVGAVPDMADLLELAPHRERGYFHRLGHGPLADVPVPGPPIRFGDGEWRSDPAPGLGTSNQDVLSDRPQRGGDPAGPGTGGGR